MFLKLSGRRWNPLSKKESKEDAQLVLSDDARALPPLL